MVAPITGPFSTSISNGIDGTGSYRIDKIRWRQKKPFNKALAYRHVKIYTLRASVKEGRFLGGMANANTGKSGRYYAMTFSPLDADCQKALNLARNRFMGKISERSEWLVNLAERKQAMQMMSNRLLQVYRFAKAARKGQLSKAARELGINPKVMRQRSFGDNVRAGAKSFANTFLEFHFGWEPLVKDIYAAAELLSSDFSPVPIRGRGKVDIPYASDTGWVSSNWHYSSRNHVESLVTIKAQVGATVQITNPNLHLAASMGLINPATVVWELVPFSFVVDWFVNVGEYLAQFTDTVGVDFIEPYHTIKAVDDCVSTTDEIDFGLRSNVTFVQSRAISVERKLGIPSVTLGKRPPWKLSATRAITACSLLIQQGIR